MSEIAVQDMLAAHEVITKFTFDRAELDMGYTGKTLRVDLDKMEVSANEVTQEMKDLWVGGKGFDLWLMLQEINKNTKWDSNENPICMSSGPLGGTTSFPGSGKTLVTTISPLTDIVIDCNVGGYFGPYLKFAGFDAMTVVGKAAEDSIIYLDATTSTVTVEKAPKESVDSHKLAEELTMMYADDDLDMRNIAVVSAGTGAEHSRMGVLNFSFWDWRRNDVRLKQAGRGGVGTVLRNKKIKAIVVRNREIAPPWSVEESKVINMVLPSELPAPQCKGEVTEIKEIIQKWNADSDYVIEMMQDVQERFRHISKKAIETIRDETGTPLSYLYHIATFYKTFSLDKKGEKTIQVCMGTACHVKGAANIVDSFERNLGVKCGETTNDGKFTLEAVACLGACSIAPVVKLGEEVVGNVRAKDVKKLLETVKVEAGGDNA